MEDVREKHKIKHLMGEILAIALCAIVAEADFFSYICEFGNNNLEWLRKYLPYKNGIPSHDRLVYFLSSINPKDFKSWFI